MAKFGAKHPCFAKKAGQVAGQLPTYEAGVVLGKLVSANVTVQNATGELYADDVKAEYASEFSSASCAMETDDMLDNVAAAVYDATVVDGEVHYNAGDTPPEGGLSYYKVLMRNGVKHFEGYYYPRVRAAIGNDNAQTKGSSITFGTTQTTFEILDPEVASSVGGWRITKIFDDEAAARAWVESKVNVSASFEVNVTVNGDGAVTPGGVVMVASGQNLQLSFGANDPDVLYDNGVDVTSSITSHKYTISSIAEDHTITAVYASA